MFFELPDISVSISSVHSLAWESRREEVAKRHSHALSFRIRGTGRIITEDGEISADDGSIIYFPCNKGYTYRSDGEELIVVYFTSRFPCSENIIKYTPTTSAFFESAFKELYEVWTRREAGSYLKAKSLFYSILSRLTYEQSDERQDSAYRKLRPAIKAINSEYTSPDLTVSRLAEMCGVSETYLRRVFSRIYGTSPLSYINGLRISRAKEMLESRLYSVAEVAQRSGFADIKYFSTAFKRSVGVTPSDYMNK